MGCCLTNYEVNYNSKQTISCSSLSLNPVGSTLRSKRNDIRHPKGEANRHKWLISRSSTAPSSVSEPIKIDS